MRKNDGTMEAALFIDNKYTRSAQGKSITELFTKLAGPLLSQPVEEGTELAINIGVLTPVEAARVERRLKREKETAEAIVEAEEQEKLNAALDREAKAKQGDVPNVV